jgi:hypothetical protein
VNKRARAAATVTLFAGIAFAVLTLTGGTASAAPSLPTGSSVAAPSHAVQPMKCIPRMCG